MRGSVRRGRLLRTLRRLARSVRLSAGSEPRAARRHRPARRRGRRRRTRVGPPQLRRRAARSPRNWSARGRSCGSSRTCTSRSWARATSSRPSLRARAAQSRGRRPPWCCPRPGEGARIRYRPHLGPLRRPLSWTRGTARLPTAEARCSRRPGPWLRCADGSRLRSPRLPQASHAYCHRPPTPLGKGRQRVQKAPCRRRGWAHMAARGLRSCRATRGERARQKQQAPLQAHARWARTAHSRRRQ